MECTNCTACIDACNFMMDKVGLPKDLIRYASENNIEKSEKLKYTTRMKAYTVVLFLLIALMTFLLATRKNIDAHITRARGQLYNELPGDKLSNLYEIKLINKTDESMPIEMKLEGGLAGEIKLVGSDKIQLKKSDYTNANFFIIIDKNKVITRKTKLEVGVYCGNKKITTVKTNFLGPFI
jgi:polyferredoxin